MPDNKNKSSNKPSPAKPDQFQKELVSGLTSESFFPVVPNNKVETNTTMTTSTGTAAVNTADVQRLKGVARGSGTRAEDAKKITYDNTSSAELLSKGAKGMAINAVSSFAESWIDFLNPMDNLNTLAGNGGDFNSSIFGLSTADIAEWRNEALADNVILRGQEGFAPGDMGFWADQVSNFGTSVGMIGASYLQTLATMGVGKALTLGKDASKIAGIIDKLGATSKQGKALQAIDNLIQSGKFKQGAWAFINRVGESKMEARQTYDAVLEKQMSAVNADGSLKFSREQAEANASKAAQNTFNMNMPLMLMDYITFGSIASTNPFTGAVTAGAEKYIGKILGEGALGTTAKVAKNQLTTMLSEGTEEGLQFMIGNLAEDWADENTGLKAKTSTLARIAEYLQDEDLYSSIVGGMLGGGVLGGIGAVKQGRQDYKNQKAFDIAMQEYVARGIAFNEAVNLEVLELEKQGKSAEAQALKAEAFRQNIFEGAILDTKKGRSVALENQRILLRGAITAIEEGDEKAALESGIDISSMDSNARSAEISRLEGYLSTVDQVESSFTRAKEDGLDSRSIYQRAVNYYGEVANTQAAEESKDSYEKAWRSSALYNNLPNSTAQAFTATAQEISALEVEKDRLTKALENVKGRAKRKGIESALEKVEERITDLTDNKESLMESLKEEKKWEDTRKAIGDNLIPSNILGNLMSSIRHSSEAQIARTTAETYGQPSYINSLKRDLRIYNTIDKIESLKSDAEAWESLPTEMRSNIENKLKALRIKEAREEAVTPAPPPAPVVDTLPTPPPDHHIPLDQLLPPPPELDFSQEVQDSTGQPPIVNPVSVAAQTLLGLPTVNSSDIFGEVPTGYTSNEVDPNQAFAPRVVNENKFESQKDAITEAVEVAQRAATVEIGKEATFEDTMNAFIRSEGTVFADEYFSLIAKGWNNSSTLPNLTPQEVLEAYDRIFSSVKSSANRLRVFGESGLLEDPKGIEAPAPNNPVASTLGVVAQPLTPAYSVTTNSGNRIPVSNFPFVTGVAIEDGKPVITRDTTDTEFLEHPYIQHQTMLNDNLVAPGTTLLLVVPDGQDGRPNIEDTYIDGLGYNKYDAASSNTGNLPILVTLEDGTIVGQLPDVGWYDPARGNFAPEQRDQAVANLMAVREAVVQAQGSPLAVTVDSKRPTNFYDYLQPDKTVTLAEANPQIQIVIGTGKGEYILPNSSERISPDKVFVPLDPETGMPLFNPDINGTPYELRKYGFDINGEQMYLANPIHANQENSSLTPAELDSIFAAIEIYLTGSSSVEELRGIPGMMEAYQSLLDSSNGSPINILSASALVEYLKQFIMVDFSSLKNLSKNAETKDFATIHQIVKGYSDTYIQEILNRNTGPSGSVIIMFNPFGDIIVGIKGVVSVNGGPMYYPFPVGSSLNDITVKEVRALKTTLLESLKLGIKAGDLFGVKPVFSRNISKTALKEDTPVKMIGEDFSVTVPHESYQEHVKGNVKTNLISKNVGTLEEPFYATNSQPELTYSVEGVVVAPSLPVAELATLDHNTVVTEIVEEESKKVEDLAEVIVDEVASEEVDTLDTVFIDSVTKEVEDFLTENGFDLGVTDSTDTEFFEPRVLTDQELEGIESVSSTGLSPNQEVALANYLHSSAVNLNRDGVVASSALDTAISDLVSSLDEKAESAIVLVQSLQAMLDSGKLPESRVQKVTSLLESAKKAERQLSVAADAVPKLKDRVAKSIEKVSILNSNLMQLDNQTLEDGGVLENIVEEEVQDELSPEDTIENSYSKGSDQIDRKMSVPHEVRALMQGIFQMDPEGELVKGFFGLPVPVGYDVLYYQVKHLLSDLNPNFQEQMETLRGQMESFPYLQVLIDRLETSSDNMKKKFTSSMSGHAIEMEFVQMSVDKSGTHTLRVINTNNNQVSSLLLRDWSNKLLRSPIVKREGMNVGITSDSALAVLQELEGLTGNIMVENISSSASEYLTPEEIALVTKSILNLRTMLAAGNSAVTVTESTFKGAGNPKELYQKFLNFVINKGGSITDKNGLVSNTYMMGNSIQVGPQFNHAEESEVRDFLAKLGITFTDKGWSEVYAKGFYDRKAGAFTSLSSMLTSINTPSHFNLFRDIREGFQRIAQTPFYNLQDNTSPVDSKVLRKLAQIEAKFDTTQLTSVIRDGDKTVFTLSVSKFITDRVARLKRDEEDFIAKRMRLSYSKNSDLLALLQKDSDFRLDWFGVVHLPPSAFKVAGNKNTSDKSYTSLDSASHSLTKIGLFTRNNGITISSKLHGHNLRAASYINPTNSDKTGATQLKSYAYEILFDENGAISAASMDMAYQQLIAPDLTRFVNSNQKVVNTASIKAYNEGATYFYSIPELNYLKVEDVIGDATELGKVSIDYTPGAGTTLRDFIIANPELNVELIQATFKAKMIEILRSHIAKQADKTLNSWYRDNLFKASEDGISLESTKLPPKETSLNPSYPTIGAEGEAQMNKLKMFASDFTLNTMIANANNFMVMAGDPALYYKKGKLGTIRSNITETFINVGKRLANQIAPGVKLAELEYNEKGSKYLQIFLADFDMSYKNVDYLKELLGDSYKDFMKNESTDAQEYTTWEEHLYILDRLGRIPDSGVEITSEDLRIAREAVASGVAIDKMTEAQQIALKKVAQPLKPVMATMVLDEANDVDRVVYIKTSSFPLLPQLTTGKEIDKLRQLLEAAQKKSGRFVRASYQSGNKVGASEKGLPIWDKDGRFNMDLVEATSETGEVTFKTDLMDNLVSPTTDDAKTIKPLHSLMLDRNDFKIQQDVPDKSAYSKENVITMGTQPNKLLFGDGVVDLKDFYYKNEKMDGRELLKKYTKLYADILKQRKLELYDRLSLNSEGKSYDLVETKKVLQEMLKEEAETRGLPQQTIDYLELVPTAWDADGNVINMDFATPLWLNPDSTKFEALLTSLVKNKITGIKMPGWSSPVGSEAGFLAEKELPKGVVDKMIYTKYYNKEKGLQGYRNEDGSPGYAQVFVRPKFKNADGIDVNLFEKKGGEFVYLNETKNEDGEVTGYTLKDGKIQEEMLQAISFRIPTSKHSSLAVIEIAGFLPDESADLMIVPNHFTTQKGLDFDIDKESVYSFFHSILPDGSIIKRDFEKTFEATHGKSSSEFMEEYDNVRREYFKFNKDVKAVERLLEKNERSQEDQSQILTPEEEGFLERALNRVDKSEDIVEKFYYMREIARSINQSKEAERSNINNIIEVFHSVLTHPEVRKKTLTSLSIDLATEQAEIFQELLEGSISEEGSDFSPMSDEYQKSKVYLGAAGKVGISAYSQDVVTQALLQTLETPVEILEWVFTGKGWISKGREFSFGGVTESGVLGKSKGKFSVRTIAEVLAERQNIATDNEKAQVMGRVNLNSYTLDADKMMTLLGFDTTQIDGQTYSVSLLLLNQPVIREYVRELSSVSSQTADFVVNKERYLADKMSEMFGFTVDTLELEDPKTDGSLLSPKAMLTELKIGTTPAAQKQALLRFLELSKLGKQMREVQGHLSYDSKGVGANYFVASEKKENFFKVLRSKEFADIEGLFGTLNTKNEFTPTTVAGYFASNSLEAASSIMDPVLPYANDVIADYLNFALKSLGKQEASYHSRAKIKKDLFKTIKMGIYSSSKTKIFEAENAQAERARLFSDEGSNISLGAYLQVLKSEFYGDANVRRYILEDKLLGGIDAEYLPQFNITVLKHKGVINNNVDSEYMYRSIPNLLKEKRTLPDNPSYQPVGITGEISEFDFSQVSPNIKNTAVVSQLDSLPVEMEDAKTGERFIYNHRGSRFILTYLGDNTVEVESAYNTRSLGQDLIAAAFLEGGVQEAVQFIKYIPVDVMEAIGANRIFRVFSQSNAEVAFNNMLNMFNVLTEDGEVEVADSSFFDIHVGHNPESVPKISKKFMQDNPGSVTFWKASGKSSLVDDSEVAIISDSVFSGKNPTHFSYKISDGVFAIYKQGTTIGDSTDTIYHRIPQYGTFGVSEVTIARDNAGSIIKYNSFIHKDFQVESYYTPPVRFDAEVGSDVRLVLEKGGTVQEVFEALSEMGDLPPNAQAVLEIALESGKLEGLVITTSNSESGPKASYSSTDKTINLNLEALTNDMDLAVTLLKEVAHHLVMQDYLKDYTLTGEVLPGVVASKESEALTITFNSAKTAMANRLGIAPAEFRAALKEFRDNLHKPGKSRGVISKETVPAVLWAALKRYSLETASSTESAALEMIYPLIDVAEFTESMLLEDNFRELFMEESSARPNSVFSQFWEALKAVLSKALSGVRDGSLTQEAIQNTLELIFKNPIAPVTGVQSELENLQSIMGIENTSEIDATSLEGMLGISREAQSEDLFDPSEFDTPRVANPRGFQIYLEDPRVVNRVKELALHNNLIKKSCK